MRRINLLTDSRVISHHWNEVMCNLHNESPCQYYDSEYYNWLEKEWKFKVITTEEDSEGYVIAYEIEDSTFALLLLKFPLDED